jgi:hypothetical protein
MLTSKRYSIHGKTRYAMHVFPRWFVIVAMALGSYVAGFRGWRFVAALAAMMVLFMLLSVAMQMR